MDTNNLGEVLKARRKAKKLTLRQLATMSGVSGSHLGRIESGYRFPSAHILRRLANPLGFTEVDLLKLAGFISHGQSDDRVDRLKEEIKREIVDALLNLHKKIDSL